MTQNDFLARLRILAKVCDYQLPMELLALYDRALSRFGYDRATTAIEEAIIQRRGNDRMPSIGDLVDRCSPQILETDSAVDVAARIWGAISKFGWANATLAHDWIGEVGWHIVSINGGWQRICETAQSKDVGVWKAQLRDHAAAALRRHKAGVLGAAPKFGETSISNRMSALVGDVMKNVGSTKNGSARISGGVPRQSGDRIEHVEGNSRVTETVQS